MGLGLDGDPNWEKGLGDLEARGLYSSQKELGLALLMELTVYGRRTRAEYELLCYGYRLYSGAPEDCLNHCCY